MMSTSLPGFAEAAAMVQEYAANIVGRRPRTEIVGLHEVAGRVLAEPLRADQDMPSFPRSTRDGFACRAKEASRHNWLRVTGSIRAGDPPAGPLPPGCAWEIMTGAAVPEGADAVVMLEHVEQQDGRVRLADGRKLEAGDNIVPSGAEARAGAELIPRGTRMSASQIAAAACCGYSRLQVHARAKVAILTTGDELVGVEARPGLGQIRNSNAPMLAALVEQTGGAPWILPSARDEAPAIEATLRQARVADLLLISGGVSAGKFDLVEPALEKLGGKFRFTGVRIQPGKPLVFGEMEREGAPLPFFGLPGNPISSAATFLLFAAPVLRALLGNCDRGPAFGVARAARDVKGKPGLTRFVPSHVEAGGHGGRQPEVRAVNWQGSGDLAAFAQANCFVMVPEGTERIEAGELAHVLPI